MNFIGNKVTEKRKSPFSREKGDSFLELVLNRSAYGANRSAVAAADAGICVDDVLVIALGDGADGAFLGAGAALDAIVGDLKSHDVSSLKQNKYKSLVFS